MPFNVGEIVGVPCSYAKGAFDNELMVSFEYEAETISGFVRRENLTIVDDHNGLLKAQVLSVDGEVRLKLYGSFFTTNGIEPFQAEWARNHLNRLKAAA